jgi:hypothetical protein
MTEFPSNWGLYYCKSCEVEISEFDKYNNDALCDKCKERKEELLTERGKALAELEAIKVFNTHSDRISELIIEIEYINEQLKNY